MKHFLLAAVSCLFLSLSLNAFAAKPTSITFEANHTTADGTEYATYAVACSNGKIFKLSAWDKRKKWCPGEGGQDNCERKQIKAAKKACK